MSAVAQVLPGARLAALDCARGLAVLTMFVAHGYDGWVAAEHKLGASYRVTRELSAVAMPSFVVFAGVGLGLGMRSVAAAGGGAREARGRVLARSLRLLLVGYALALAYALLDGGLTWRNVLRADALHAIGASIAVCAALLPWGASRGPTLPTRAFALALALLAATPWLSRALHDLSPPLGYALAPLVHVDGVSRFQALPLSALCAGGVVLATSGLLERLAAMRTAVLITLAAAALAAAFRLATAHQLQALGGALSPAHLAVLPNALDGFCRALGALGLGALAALHGPAGLRSALQALGQRSLWIYALHLPLCYGRLSRPMRGQLDLADATLAVAVLAVLAAGLSLASFSFVRTRSPHANIA